MRMPSLALALLLASSALAQPTIPATPAGRVFAAWLSAFNSNDVAAVGRFDDTYRRGAGQPPPPPEATVRFRAQTGGFALVRIEKRDKTTIVALLEERDSDTIARLELAVAGDPPTIATFALRAVPRPPDLAVPRRTEPEALAALGQRLDELAAADRFSGVVAIARHGHLVFERFAGRADRKTNTPVTAETRFRIDSMNKRFTSIAILQLVEAGALALDDPIGKHLTDYPNAIVASRVTIRHLLTHTGGTGDILGPDFAKRRLTLREHGDYVTLYGARGLTHEPGAELRYSNYGFVLLGATVGRATGRSYDDVVRRNALERAGMTATGSLPESDAVPHRSAGYMRRDGRWVSNADTLPWRGTAAGSGYSTAADLLRFARALDAGTLVSKPMLAEATTARRDVYGCGFNTRCAGAGHWYGHGGGAPGMNSELRVYPERAYAIVGLSNLDPPATSRAVEFFALRMPASAATPTTRQPAATPSPPGTDIWLARLTAHGIEQPINITNRPGYENQPSFTPDGTGILFTRSDGTQTDVYLYDLKSRGTAATRVTDTPESEYSPTVTPDDEGISVIRVEANGDQRLWRFTRDGRSPTLVLRDVKPVGYHAWGPNGLLALFVLGAPTPAGRPPNPSTLQVADSRTGRARIVARRIGRSMHRIPGRRTISVLHIEGNVRTIKELDPKTRALTPIVRAPGSPDGDYAWTPDGAILMSNGRTLLRSGGGEWTAFADLAALGLGGASRLAVSPDGRWLALVVPDRPAGEPPH